jgi:C4-dicarboxylate transporter DctM subunit
MYPALLSRQYPDRFSLGLVTSAGSLGIIIPPSIPMIVYAIFATQANAPVKVEELFIAGFLPGVLIATAMIAFCIVVGWSFDRESFDLKKIITAFADASWSLIVPVVILGGIYLGVFDTTAASAIAVILALVIEMFIHRSLTFDDLPGVMAECGVLMGAVLVIIGVALGMSEYLTIHQVPDQIVAWLRGQDLSPISFIIILDVILLVIGCLMDIVSAIILFVPLFVPIALALGFDPIHIGLIFIVNLEIGYLTPPIGLNLFVASGLFDRTFGYALRACLPFVLIIFLCLAVITMVPAIPLSLVNAIRPDHEQVSMAFPSGASLRARTTASATEDKPKIDVMALARQAIATDGQQSGSSTGKVKSVAQVMAEARDSGVVDDIVGEEDFTPVGTIVETVIDDQGVRRTVVYMADSELCGEPSQPGAAFTPDDDTLVLRIGLPHRPQAGGLVVGAQAKVELLAVEAGALTVRSTADQGKVAIVTGSGHPEGLFGVFSVHIDGHPVQGKFLPQPCDDGEVAAFAADATPSTATPEAR